MMKLITIVAVVLVAYASSASHGGWGVFEQLEEEKNDLITFSKCI